jgi:hypothetical protein
MADLMATIIHHHPSSSIIASFCTPPIKERKRSIVVPPRQKARMRPFFSAWSACLLATMYLLLIALAEGFLRMPTDRRIPGYVYHSGPGHHCQQQSFIGRLPAPVAQSPSDDDWDDVSNNEVPDGPEKSQMYSFISNYLSKENANADAAKQEDRTRI